MNVYKCGKVKLIIKLIKIIKAFNLRSGLVWCGNAYSVKGVGVCGLQSQLTDMSDAMS